MKNKKINFKNILFLSLIFGFGFVFIPIDSVDANCPPNTEVGDREATLVGEVTDYGGDPNLKVWFQYTKRVLGYDMRTESQSQYGSGVFCATIENLDPCSTYYFRAVAENSAGTSYGARQSFKTECYSLNIRANNSNGPITVSYESSINLTWSSENMDSCQASGDWSGSRPSSGSEAIKIEEVKTYNFTIVCQNSAGDIELTDSVVVNVRAALPSVTTKPAVTTY